MPKEQEVLRFGDREVTVTNPSKVFFEAIGATKLDHASHSGQRPSHFVER